MRWRSRRLRHQINGLLATFGWTVVVFVCLLHDGNINRSCEKTYSLSELLRKWGKNELTVEQAMGHFFQHLTELEKRLRNLEQPPMKP